MSLPCMRALSRPQVLIPVNPATLPEPELPDGPELAAHEGFLDVRLGQFLHRRVYQQAKLTNASMSEIIRAAVLPEATRVVFALARERFKEGS